jgi:sulfate adenylyltransferase subunit 1
VAQVNTADGPLPTAGAGRSVTILLSDDIDLSRGDLIAAAGAPPRVTSELGTTLCWLAATPLRPGARLLLKHGTRTTQVIVGAITGLLDPDTLTFGDPPDRLQINDIAHVGLRTADPLPVDDYADVRATGSFLLIDPPTGNTLAAGLVGEPLADALR